MNDFQEQVKLRKDFLNHLQEQKKTALKKVPEGSLRASPHRKQVQYFVVNENTSKKGHYLKQSLKNDQLVSRLAQKEYDTRVLRAAGKELKILNKLDSLYETAGKAEDQFEKISPYKRDLINPFEVPDDLFVQNWINEEYIHMQYRSEEQVFYSDKNEKMRSKSEVIIANMLNKAGVPYRYECQLNLGGTIVYPDFVILNVRTREIWYWEHLGMMDDPDYISKNLSKIARYEMNGIYLGKNLIVTYETRDKPLNMKLVAAKIREFCV